MTKVLHIYPKDQSLTARYVRLLGEAAGSAMDLRATEQSAEAWKICKDWRPDIVHLFGQATVHSGPFRCIVSPCGTDADTSNCFAVIARSHIEAQHLSEQGARRIEVVLNPLITKTTDFATAARSTLAIYQKVMDSDPLPLMNDDTRRLLAVALKAAICGDRRWVGDAAQNLPGTADFRLLYIYASLEGVLPLVEKGLRLLDISAPQREPSESYLPEGYRKPESMAFKTLTEQLQDIRSAGPSLLRLTEIHQGLLNPRLNEDLLCQSLDEKGMLPLFASVLQLLREQTLLDEGFCPCPPEDNGVTKSLRTKLKRHLQL